MRAPFASLAFQHRDFHTWSHEQKMSAAAALLGAKGGRQRAAAIDAKQRRAIASAGGRAKWAALKSKAARRRATASARAARWKKKRAR